jgi:hypothetical protein
MPSWARRGPDVDHGHRERRRLQHRDALTCGNGWWACQDLNLGPHPCQQSRAQRRADRRFPRSLASVRGEGMRSNSSARISAPTRCRGRRQAMPATGRRQGDGAAGWARQPHRSEDPGLGQLRRWTGWSAAMPGRRASCHQPRTVHRRRRGGRAPRASRAWSACTCRWVMRCSASTWLSPACWLCMVLPTVRPAGPRRPQVAGWFRMALGRALRIRHLPYIGARLFPISWRRPRR